ncbi:hypothetical protein D3C72_2459470 [compost metagenome]
MAILLRRTPITASLNLHAQNMIGQRRHGAFECPILDTNAAARHRHDAVGMIRTVADPQIISRHGKMQAE